MVVTIPESSKDITLEQFQRLHELNSRKDVEPKNYEREFINIFTGIPKRQVDKIKLSDYERLATAIVEGLKVDAPFNDRNRFTLKGVEYGFIPNLDDMTSGEFMHLAEYEKEVKDLHKLMAVLYRPIVKTDKFGNYEIQSYKSGAERAKLFKSMTMDNVKGAQGFFLTLSQQLKRAIQKSTAEVLAREAKRKTTSLNGVGMQPS